MNPTFVKQRSVNHYYADDSFAEISFEPANHLELELESILIEAFKQGLPCDLSCAF